MQQMWFYFKLVSRAGAASSATVGRCVHSMVGLHRWPLWGNHRIVWSSRPELAIGEDREWHQVHSRRRNGTGA